MQRVCFVLQARSQNPSLAARLHLHRITHPPETLRAACLFQLPKHSSANPCRGSSANPFLILACNTICGPVSRWISGNLGGNIPSTSSPEGMACSLGSSVGQQSMIFFVYYCYYYLLWYYIASQPVPLQKGWLGFLKYWQSPVFESCFHSCKSGYAPHLIWHFQSSKYRLAVIARQNAVAG